MFSLALSLAALAPTLLADADDGPAPEDVTPGLLGFAVVALLALVLWFLLRSMNSRLRKVRFDETDPGADRVTKPDGQGAGGQGADGQGGAEETRPRGPA